MGLLFGAGLRGQGTLPVKAIRQSKRSRIVLASIGAPTSFEQKLMIKAGEKGEILFSSKTLGTFRPVIEGNNIIGYYRSSNGFYELLDREGRRIWSDERGIEPSVISPVDIVGPALVTGAVRGIMFRLTVPGVGRGITGGISATLARALAFMRAVARKILSTRVVVEIGAGDLKACLKYLARTVSRNIKMIAIEPDSSYYAATVSSFRAAGGVVVNDTQQVMTGIADEVFQYFPFRYSTGVERMITHAPQKMVSEALRIARPRAIIKYVTEHEGTAKYLVSEANRLGAKQVTLSTTSDLAKVAPGASAAGVPSEALSRTVFYVVRFSKSGN
jgi:hypothetical protein